MQNKESQSKRLKKVTKYLFLVKLQDFTSLRQVKRTPQTRGYLRLLKIRIAIFTPQECALNRFTRGMVLLALGFERK